MKNTGITAKKTSFWSKGNWKKLLGISLLMVAPLVGYYTFWLMSLGLLIMGFGIMGLGVADELKASEFLAKESHKEEKPERIGKLVFVILSVGLLAIAGLQITSARGNFFSKNLTQASYVAQDRLEFLGNLPFDSPQLQPGSHNDGKAILLGLAFNRTYNVMVNGNLKTITYTVNWNDGVNRSISFSTFLSQYG